MCGCVYVCVRALIEVTFYIDANGFLKVWAQDTSTESRTESRLRMKMVACLSQSVSHDSQIEVTLDIEANGILKIAAQDMSTGKSNLITITNE